VQVAQPQEGNSVLEVDWDGAALAPRERDLALFSGQGFARFLDDYEHAAGGCDLDPDLIAFFLRAATSTTWLTGWALCSPMNARRAATRGPRRGAVVPVALDALERRIEQTRLLLARRHGRGR
jgi:hypothetical protein